MPTTKAAAVAVKPKDFHSTFPTNGTLKTLPLPSQLADTSPNQFLCIVALGNKSQNHGKTTLYVKYCIYIFLKASPTKRIVYT